MKRKLTDDQVAEAREMRSKGISYPKICTALGVGRGVVVYALDPQRAAYYATYRKTHKKEAATYRRIHEEERRLYNTDYRREHKEEFRIRDAAYFQEHKKERRLHSAAYREKHKEEQRRYMAIWNRAHRPEHAARSAARKALIRGATVGDFAEIKEIYRKAKEAPKIRCYLCGKLIPKGRRHVDHIVPLSKGGAHRPSNLAVADDGCNMEKHTKLPEQVGLLL